MEDATKTSNSKNKDDDEMSVFEYSEEIEDGTIYVTVETIPLPDGSFEISIEKFVFRFNKEFTEE
jgi:hypothetical protein